MSDGIESDPVVAARITLDDDVLASHLRQTSGEDAGGRVQSAVRPITDNQSHIMGRPALRVSGTRQGAKCCDPTELQKTAAGEVHVEAGCCLDATTR